MQLEELTGFAPDKYSLDSAVVFHDELNQNLFDQQGQMLPEIRFSLLQIAKHFKDFIGVPLQLLDVTISGSNAAYSYTPYSDIDLHLVVKIPNDVKYKELLDAKKNVYNAQHDITVKGIDVELYAQDSSQPHYSLGIYSILKDTWVSEPVKEKPDINSDDVRLKYKNYRDRIREVLKSNEKDVVKSAWDTIKRMRKASLEQYGEFAAENLVYKILRNQGWIEKITDHIDNLTDKELSVEGTEQ